MAIASKPKPKQTIHHKRRAGQHHRQSKHYMKTYWPYLPMLAGAAFINALLSSTSTTTFAAAENTSRIEAWTNAGPWLTAAIVAIGVLSITIVVARHTLAWQRAVAKSEDFFVHHHSLDIILVGVVLAGIVVTRSS